MAKKNVFERAMESLEAEIVPLQQQIDIRQAAISKLRDQNFLVRRKRAAKAGKSEAVPREMAVGVSR